MERSTPRIVARNRFDGALFDLDGVLTDSAALHAADRVALSGGEAVRQPARGVVDEDVHGAELGLGVVEEAPGSPRVDEVGLQSGGAGRPGLDEVSRTRTSPDATASRCQGASRRAASSQARRWIA